MIVQIDLSAATPPYEQVRAQLAGLIGAGSLPAGTRLPAVRQLAADLGLAPGTVARAYRNLEESGLIVTRGRHGTHVAAHVPGQPPAQARAHLARIAAEFAAAATQLGAGPEAALAAARDALAAARAHQAGPSGPGDGR